MESTSALARACPRCGSDHVRPSRARGLEFFVRFCGLGHSRCEKCNHRFYSLRKWGKKQTQAVYAIMLAVGLAAFCYIMIKFLGVGRGHVD
jgi:DNA-directed RNA polymerase subunit RPC12/RpoP